MNTSNLKQTIIRKAKKFAIKCIIAVVIAVPIRQCIAVPVRVPTGAVAPEVPPGSLALVYRLASDFKPGDIIVYRADAKFMVARCEAASSVSLHVSRYDQQLDVPRNAIVGKVVLSTR
jgi:signal peptidase I